MKLSEVQRELLECCPDWSAPYEVAERRRELGRVVFARSTAMFLRRMMKLGLVEYGKANDTYRITEAGRAALGKAP
jgi:Mn-dependent DtxR family transcriptional regulator